MRSPTTWPGSWPNLIASAPVITGLSGVTLQDRGRTVAPPVREETVVGEQVDPRTQLGGAAT